MTAVPGPQSRLILPTDGVSGLFEAVLDATEEAIDNSLLKATDVLANGRTIRAIPIEALQALLKKVRALTLRRAQRCHDLSPRAETSRGR